uniref:Peptidase S1 domain-containing protein n=1 Tax=Glossina pallidipes TaxID=7398 RepID=A0A1A9ZAN9_GLOPL
MIISFVYNRREAACRGRGPMNSDDIEVVAGTPKRLQKVNTTQSSIAEKLVVHRRYVSFSVQYDIGLIKLKDEFKLNEYAVAAISLPTSAPVDGMECTLLGWGRMYQNGPLPDAVLYVSLDLLTYKSCKERLIIINAGNICGWDPNNNMKGACKGDSGGPLICDDCVSGIVSYGMDCDVGVPDAYTNNGPMADQIQGNTIGVLTHTSCARTVAPINDGKLCAFDEHHVEKGACKGDSGGPLICNEKRNFSIRSIKGTVSGIVSSRENCDWGIPTTLTNVYYFLEWIEKNVAQRIAYATQIKC